MTRVTLIRKIRLRHDMPRTIDYIYREYDGCAVLQINGRTERISTKYSHLKGMQSSFVQHYQITCKRILWCGLYVGMTSSPSMAILNLF